MPNGGSDCCGTCWFNKRNQGERSRMRMGDASVPPYCEIREVGIVDPFYTYCANHPRRRRERDPIPIGPITRYAGDGMSNDRKEWMPSPDSEEIRLHLLKLLDDFFVTVSKDRYPIGAGLGEVVMRQLGEFREKRAERHIRWIGENLPEPWKSVAAESLERIAQAD